MVHSPTWWHQSNNLEQWLDDFLSDALRRHGRSELLQARLCAPSQLLTDYKSLGFSSLDMVTLASRFAACLGLNHTGLSDLLLAKRSAAGWCEVARRSLGINDRHVGFYSSGSTGRPALSVHALQKLQCEAHFFAQLLAPFKRIVCAVPSHHIYGFIWGNILPVALNTHCLRLNPITSLPVSWAAQFHEHDVIVATPDIWRLLLELDVALPTQFAAISSTAPLAPEVAEALSVRFPESTQLAVYGSTETAGLAWRYWTQADYQLLPWWQLTEQHDRATVYSERFDEQHTLDDQLVIGSNGRFQLLGRLDDVVQIAGHNINLVTLASTLTSHPDLLNAKVRYQYRDGRHELHYFLALRECPSTLPAWCEQFSVWLSQAMGDVPPPASVILAASLPANTLNKTLSWDEGAYPVIAGVFKNAFPR
ncbi:hypothetical protein E3V39_01595 [Gammaproteobacteria bacterium LSUCC0112]|nr:hypothetical protein E3V39_01595 [Gammaproteobacteria bacterium LSUCC0112]